jgi:CRP-like cAMP-binding protein
VDKNVLSGNLKYLSLGDVIQLLGANGSTGVLRLITRYAPEPAYVYFQEGNPINASVGQQSGIDAIYSLFGWTEGDFEFSQRDDIGQRVINKSRMGIILEGLKLKDDGKIEIIGPESAAKRLAVPSAGGGIPIIKGPLVDYMCVVDEEDFYDGENIVEEGRHGNWIWVILEGVVEISRKTDQGEVPIIRIGDGSFIGSLATFLIHGNVRTASAVAIGNVQLGVLDSQRLAQEYAALPIDFRGFLISLDRRLKQVSDCAVDYFLNRVVAVDKASGGSVVVKQGANEEGLYLIRQGSAQVVRQTEKGPVTLCQLGKGDYYGNPEFLHLDHEPAFASVQASDDFQSQSVAQETFTRQYERLSTTFRNMVDNLCTCISVTSNVACKFESRASQQR